MSDMPEEIFAFKGARKGSILVDTIPDNNTAYLLKSTVDAGRAEDDKTITELAESAQAVIDRWDTPNWKDVEHTASFINKLRKALTDNAPRIAEAQEGEG